MKANMKKFLVSLFLLVTALSVTVATNVKAAPGDVVSSFEIKNADATTSYLTGDSFTAQMILTTNSTSTETITNPKAKITIPKAYVSDIRLGQTPTGTSCQKIEDANNFYVDCTMNDITGGYSLSMPIDVITKNLTTPNGSIVHITGTLTDGTTTNITATPLDITLKTNPLDISKQTCPSTITLDTINGNNCAGIEGTEDGILLYGGLADPNNSTKLSTNLNDLNNLRFMFHLPKMGTDAPLGTRGFDTFTITDTLPVGTVFNAADNPGWTNNGNGTVSYIVKAGTNLPTFVALAIKAPGATVNHSTTAPWTYTNTATATVIPINKIASEANYTDTDGSKYNLTNKVLPVGVFEKINTLPASQLIPTPENLQKDYPFLLHIANQAFYKQPISNFEISDTRLGGEMDSRLKFSSLTFYKNFGATATANPTPPLSTGGSIDVYVTINGVEQFVTNVSTPSTTINVPLPTTGTIDEVSIRAHTTTTVLTGMNFYAQINTKFINPTADPLANGAITYFRNAGTLTGNMGSSPIDVYDADVFYMTPYNGQIGVQKIFYGTSTHYTTGDALLGDTIEFQLTSRMNSTVSGDTINGLKLIDILPQGLSYVPNSTVASYYNGFPNNNIKEPTVISNYKNTGSVALVWDLNGNYVSPNDAAAFHYLASLHYKTVVNQTMNLGKNTNTAYATWNQNDTIKPTPGAEYEYTDSLDLDNDGNKTEQFSQSKLNFNYVPPQSLITTKAVKGNLDSNYLMDPSFGTANFSNIATWRLTTDNSNSLQNITNLTVVDVLPYIGDTTLSPNMSGDIVNRNSAFKVTLTGPVALPDVRFIAYYNTGDYTGMSAKEVSDTTGWTTSVSNWSTVTAVKIVLRDGYTITNTESVHFDLNTMLPVRSSELLNKFAYNSFATSLDDSGANFFESNIQGVKAYEPFATADKITTSKTVSKNVAAVNDELLYTVTVKNNDSHQLGNYSLRDVISSDLTYVPNSMEINSVTMTDANDTDKAWYYGTDKSIHATVSQIPANGSFTITFKAKVNTSASGKTIPNQATFTANDTDTPAINSTNTVNTLVPNINATKSVNQQYAKVGDNLTYTVIVKNNSTFAVSGYSLRDVLDNTKLNYTANSVKINNVGKTDIGTDTDGVSVSNNTVDIKFGSLAAGSTTTILFSAKLTAASDGQSVTNTADVIAPTGYPEGPTTNLITTLVPKLELIKKIDKKVAGVDENLTYTLSLNNIGSVPSGAYTINDIIDTSKVEYIPGTLKFARDVLTSDLAPTLTDGTDIVDSDMVDMDGINLHAKLTNVSPSHSIIVQFQVKVLPGSKGTNIPNVGLADSADVNLNSITSNTVQTNVPDVSIVKSVDKTIAKTTDELNYTFTVTNNGVTPTSDLVIYDELSDYVDLEESQVIEIPTLAPGKSVELAITNDCFLKQMALGNLVNNTADIKTTTGDELEPADYTDNLSLSRSNTVTTQVHDISANKSVSATSISVNNDVTYTIDVTNNSSFAIEDYVMIDPLDLDKSMTYVPNSIAIDDKKMSDATGDDDAYYADKTVNVILPTIESKTSYKITFKVHFGADSAGKQLDNIAQIMPADSNDSDALSAKTNKVSTTVIVPMINTGRGTDGDIGKIPNTGSELYIFGLAMVFLGISGCFVLRRETN